MLPETWKKKGEKWVTHEPYAHGFNDKRKDAWDAWFRDVGVGAIFTWENTSTEDRRCLWANANHRLGWVDRTTLAESVVDDSDANDIDEVTRRFSNSSSSTMKT